MIEFNPAIGRDKPVQIKESAQPKALWRRGWVRLCVSAFTLALLLMILPREQLWNALRRISPAVWGWCLVVYLCMHLIGAIKWRLTVNRAGAGIGLLQAVRCYYGGLFGNLFLPSVVGGDLVRAGLAYRDTHSRTGLVLGSLIDRVIDFVALATVAAIGAVLLPDQLGLVSRKVILPLAVALILGIVGIAVGWRFVSVRRLSMKMRRRMVMLRRAGRQLISHPQFVVLSLLLGITLQSCMVLLNGWLGRACGLECSWAVWLFVWPLAKLSAVLPITQGGVGVREAALAALFSPFGVPAAQAVAVGLVFQSIVITGALLSGPLALVAASFSNRRADSAGI